MKLVQLVGADNAIGVLGNHNGINGPLRDTLVVALFS